MYNPLFRKIAVARKRVQKIQVKQQGRTNQRPRFSAKHGSCSRGHVGTIRRREDGRRPSIPHLFRPLSSPSPQEKPRANNVQPSRQRLRVRGRGQLRVPAGHRPRRDIRGQEEEEEAGEAGSCVGELGWLGRWWRRRWCSGGRGLRGGREQGRGGSRRRRFFR